MTNVCALPETGIIGFTFLLVRWVREFAANLRRQLQDTQEGLQLGKVPETIEMDEIYTRIKKGGREFRYGLLILGTEVKLLRM
jgi:transposase-like protein